MPRYWSVPTAIIMDLHRHRKIRPSHYAAKVLLARRTLVPGGTGRCCTARIRADRTRRLRRICPAQVCLVGGGEQPRHCRTQSATESSIGRSACAQAAARDRLGGELADHPVLLHGIRAAQDDAELTWISPSLGGCFRVRRTRSLRRPGL